ncbi:hypothetical protein Pse7367_1905 [Thalassoporum mexicanum PCC 7367]|uniref:hypothetical protein n=1 Tax=Thalassoporum mexicanum TaxID=3457544 RepID=UPI00029FE42F|nr:hypothetical protein [Pseudanabaena sp. PCC 7367]AFY70181.1 hypothetical protein Pse7367_1905 [Pseudanabaena sp. PCC 7367]
MKYLRIGLVAIATSMMAIGVAEVAQAETNCWWQNGRMYCHDANHAWRNEAHRDHNNYREHHNNYNGNVNRNFDRNRMQQQVNQAYRDIFGRDADYGGVNTYLRELERGRDISWVRHQLAYSQEGVGDIQRAYWDILGREADYNGIRTYQEYLVNGGTLSGVRRELANSTEARRRR